MKALKLALLGVAYAALELYLLLGWLATATPKETSTLWHRAFGPLTFNLLYHSEAYGLTFLGLSCLATVGFVVVLVRALRPDQADEGNALATERNR